MQGSYLNDLVWCLVLLKYLLDVLTDQEADSDFGCLTTVREAVLALNFGNASDTRGGLSLIDRWLRGEFKCNVLH
jgi:hypothetical protein